MTGETYLERYPGGNYQIYVDFSGSSEVEMCDLLYGLVRQIKPELIFEDGAGVGHGTAALGRACRDNGKGNVIACETDQANFEAAVSRVADLPVRVLLRDTNSCSAVERADFIFADGANENRIRCFYRAKPGCIFVIHDMWEQQLADFVRANGGMSFNFGRGFGLLIK